MQKILSFLKNTYRYITRKTLRMVIALCFSTILLGVIGYIIYVDLYIEKWQFPFDITIRPIDYHLRFQSIDFNNLIVQGDLELRFNPFVSDIHITNKIKYRFGPLVYSDGISLFRLWGLKILGFLSREVLRNAKAKGLKEKEPAAVPFELKLIGEPKFYPFDKYLIAGAAKCVIKDNPEGISETLKEEGLEAITVTQNIPGFLIRRAKFKEVNAFRFKEIVDKMEISDLKKWHFKNAFLLVLYRPLFLRFMTVFLGVVAFLSILCIVFWAPLRDIPVNAMGYFIALWAIREILYQGTTAFPTLIDYGVLSLYACMIIGAISKWIWPKKAS